MGRRVRGRSEIKLEASQLTDKQREPVSIREKQPQCDRRERKEIKEIVRGEEKGRVQSRLEQSKQGLEKEGTYLYKAQDKMTMRTPLARMNAKAMILQYSDHHHESTKKKRMRNRPVSKSSKPKETYFQPEYGGFQ